MKYFNECNSLDDAKKRFKRLAMQLHPDVSGRDSRAEFVELRSQFEAFHPSETKYGAELEQWRASDFADVVLQLLAIPGLDIEVVGSFIWIGGDTKPVKEQIKAVDVGEAMNRPRWSRGKSKWYLSPVGYRKTSRKKMSYDAIRGLYGAETVNRKQTVAIA